MSYKIYKLKKKIINNFENGLIFIFKPLTKPLQSNTWKRFEKWSDERKTEKKFIKDVYYYINLNSECTMSSAYEDSDYFYVLEVDRGSRHFLNNNRRLDRVLKILQRNKKFEIKVYNYQQWIDYLKLSEIKRLETREVVGVEDSIFIKIKLRKDVI